MSSEQLSFDANRSDDREAFAGIVRRYQNLVTALTFSMTGNLQQSEDLAQETFVAAWQRLSNEKSQPDVAAEKLGPWLCGIARNLTNNWLRRTTRERQTPHIPAENAAVSDSLIAEEPVDTEFSRETQAAMVWETLQHIPAHYREPLVMFYRNGASIREIAEALELTEACVKQRISRGRAMLKGEIASRFESFLSNLHPGEHFLAAVLAAIPILATSKQAVAASSAGIVAAQTASASGSSHPIFAGITTTFWSFICAIGPFLTVFIGTILGVWSGIRHAPTRRARLLMLKTVLEYYVFAIFIAMLFTLLLHYILNPIITLSNKSNSPEDFEGLILLFERILAVLIALSPLLFVFNSIRVNRKWRQIVEFESGIRKKEPKAITRKNMISWLVVALAFNAVLVCLCAGTDFRFISTEGLVIFSVPTALCIFLYCGWRISRDDAAFEKKPPRLPNLLPILTGEEKWPKGFRNRINFWGDLTGIGLGMVFMQLFSVGWYLQHRTLERLGMTMFGIPIGDGGNLLFGLSLVAYLVFVVFFAGIPRRRYWGMIFLAATIFACDAFMVCYTKLWQHVYPFEFGMVFGLNAWILICFALSGVAGLWVFRKRKNGV